MTVESTDDRLAHDQTEEGRKGGSDDEPGQEGDAVAKAEVTAEPIAHCRERESTAERIERWIGR